MLGGFHLHIDYQQTWGKSGRNENWIIKNLRRHIFRWAGEVLGDKEIDMQDFFQDPSLTSTQLNPRMQLSLRKMLLYVIYIYLGQKSKCRHQYTIKSRYGH